MKFRDLALGGLLLIGCGKSTLTETESKSNQNANEKIRNSPLNGVWTDGSGPNASFSIEGDSIRDVEHNTKTKFIMNGDSITFLDPDPNEVYSAKMYLIHADTLVYEFTVVKTKYWRFKD